MKSAARGSRACRSGPRIPLLSWIFCLARSEVFPIFQQPMGGGLVDGAASRSKLGRTASILERRSLPPSSEPSLNQRNISMGTASSSRWSRPGPKQWVPRVTIRGKRREIGLGGLSFMSLQQVRETALENRKEARMG